MSKSGLQILTVNNLDCKSEPAWVHNVDYFYGATVLDVNHLPDAYGVNTGNYIRVREYKGIAYNDKGELDFWSSVLIHEYGHYLQSRKFGSLGYGVGALNSAYHPDETDPNAWFEQDASQRGIDYFRCKVNKIESYAKRESWNYGIKRNSRDYSWMTGTFFPYFYLLNRLFF